MIGKVEQYKFMTTQLQYFNDKIVDSFKLFIQLDSAVLGGYLWLQTQEPSEEALKAAKDLVPAVLLLVGVGTVLLIAVNLTSWWGYRKQVSRLLDNKFPPKFPWSARQELVMMLAIGLATTVGLRYFS